MGNPTKKMNVNKKVSAKVEDSENFESTETVEAVASKKYQFAHTNKTQYIPPMTRATKGYQFIGGKFETDDINAASYIMRFAGVICLSDNDDELMD